MSNAYKGDVKDWVLCSGVGLWKETTTSVDRHLLGQLGTTTMPDNNLDNTFKIKQNWITVPRNVF